MCVFVSLFMERPCPLIRFDPKGKYLEIMFNDHGEPIGAKITNYLLEKGRVVGQVENERDFHVFYQFTKAASDGQRGRSTNTTFQNQFRPSFRGIRHSRTRGLRLYQCEQLFRRPWYRRRQGFRRDISQFHPSPLKSYSLILPNLAGHENRRPHTT